LYYTYQSPILRYNTDGYFEEHICSYRFRDVASVIQNNSKELNLVKRNQFIGGIIMLVGAAIVFLALESNASVPAAITLTVVGVALVAGSRRKSN